VRWDCEHPSSALSSVPLHRQGRGHRGHPGSAGGGVGAVPQLCQHVGGHLCLRWCVELTEAEGGGSGTWPSFCLSLPSADSTGSGNVLKVQQLLHICSEHFDSKEKEEDKDKKDKKEKEKKESSADMGAHQVGKHELEPAAQA